MKLRIVVLTVTLSLLLGACGILEIGVETPRVPGGGATATPPASPTTPAAPTTAPPTAPTATAPTTGDTQTYHNTEVGFELDYPAGWVADTTGISNGVILWSRKPEGPGTDGVPADVTKIDVLGMPDVPQTLDALVAQQKESLANSNGTVLSEERLQLPSGLEAVRMRLSGFGESLALFAIVNGHPVILAAYGDLSRFDEVARTLRPADGPSPEPLNFECSLAYADAGRLYCLGEGGTPIPIADAGTEGTISSPAISSDGAWVAYLINKEDGSSELWAVDVRTLTGNDGLSLPRRLLIGQTEIYADVTLWPLSYAWQAGTHTLYFNTRYTPVGGPTGPGEYTTNDLWKANADTGDVPIILGRDTAGRFALSPDGQFIAIFNPQSIALMNADGSNYRPLLEFPFILTYSEYAYKPTTVWSPDSTFFSVLVPSADPLAADASATLYRIFVADGSVQTLATLSGNFVFGGPSGADISPDGQRLAYVRVNQTTNVMELHFVNADGTGDVVVAQDVAINTLGWSPNSDHLAYSVVPGGGSYLAALEGEPQPFAPGLQAMSVEWVDGLSFYFLGGAGDQWGLYFQRLGEPTQVVASGLSNNATFDVRN
ncbi:MAG: TolB family protein [Anaerolineales bacterium]